MSVLDCLDRVVIIDDSPEEVESLKQLLVNNDISVDCYTPDVARSISLKKNRQLFFIDLSMDEGKSIKDNISTIIRPLLRRMISMNFGTYGLIMWTNHIEYLQEIIEKIQLDGDKYQLPLFILGLDKSKYLKEGNYGALFADIDKLIKKDNAACFFFNWRKSVHSGVDKTILDIYKLIPDYAKQKTELPYLMYKMALNYTGIPENMLPDYNLSLDAYKAFDELLYSDLINLQREDASNFLERNLENPWKDDFEHSIKIYAKLNTKVFIDNVNIIQNVVVPGNVYKIKEENKLLFVNEIPDNSERIVVEVTPPCDFSNKKITSRLVAGFMVDCPITKKDIKKLFSDYKFKAGNKYLLWPFRINESNKIMCFDFRYIASIEDEILKDDTKYKLLYRFKHKLFADILQKFASHTARLGHSIITPQI